MSATVLTNAAWLTAPSTQAVFAALEAGGEEARAVGGAVRNTLIGEPVADIDIATTALPEKTMELAKKVGLAVHPTGLKHGTVTVVSSGVPFEVTTLRRDEETFGRHARVAYSRDWREDAMRRDFTMNALYCDASGVVHDPLGGYKDLIARRVRFIGDAGARIREDYLRILRFYRLTSQFAKGGPDKDGHAACISHRDGLASLSGERIREELLRLFTTRSAVATVRAIAESGILKACVLPAPAETGLLDNLAQIETRLGRRPDAVLRLAALLLRDDSSLQALDRRLKLSNADRSRFGRLLLSDPELGPKTSKQAARRALYVLGRDTFCDRVLMAWARSGQLGVMVSQPWQQLLMLPECWQVPVMPVQGADILALGVAPGPMVGEVLKDFEDWWIEAGFPEDCRTTRAKLAEFAKQAATD